MSGKFQRSLQPLVKPLLAIALVALLVLGCAPGANAGGLNAGGLNARGVNAPGTNNPTASWWSWNKAKLAYTPPSRLYEPGAGESLGERIGFPLLLPFLGFGGGSLLTLLIAIAVASLSGQSSDRKEQGGESVEGGSLISVTRLSVGLLARGRHLQAELEPLADSPEDSSGLGLGETLQEAALALLRHPEYWVYGSVKTERARLVTVRAMFERLALAERTKLQPENLFRVSDRFPGTREEKREEKRPEKKPEKKETIATGGKPPRGGIQGSQDYIIVTFLVGLKGKLALPAVNGREDLRQALTRISEVESDRLRAVEILWAPQARGDTLTKDEILALDTNLKLI